MASAPLATARRPSGRSIGTEGLPHLGAASRRRALERRRRQARIRRNRLAAGAVTVAAIGGLLGLTPLGGRGSPPRATAGSEARVRLWPLVGPRLVVAGHRPSLPWPAVGQGAVVVGGVGVMGSSPGERPVPIASLTKMMTAYVVLHDHPLTTAEAGPVVRITQREVAAYARDVQAGDSSVPVKAGERLSERRLLEALLLPSADNVADLLGAWDAGSDTAFVARMNAAARRLGLGATHYADASGVDPRSRSTAVDQARLAADVMELPVVRQVVGEASLPFPVAGTIANYNPALGTDGIVGVKSGYTSAARGCLATAAYREVGGRRVLVVTVALGQPDGLYGAARADERLLVAASRSLVAVRVVPPTGAVADVSPASSPSTRAGASTSGDAAVPGWPGLVLERAVTSTRARPSSASVAGARVGTLAVRAAGRVVTRIPLVVTFPLASARVGLAPAGR